MLPQRSAVTARAGCASNARNTYPAKETLNGLLVAHYGHHVSQNTQLKAKKYAVEARTWDAMRSHTDVLADALGDGIAKQFPDKFK